MGRPSKYQGIESSIVRKLVTAFKNDFTVEEACTYAGISKDTYYRWLKGNKEFSDEMERAKGYVAMEAKKVLKREILKGNLKASQWYLERRQRELYSREIASKYKHSVELHPFSDEEISEIRASLDDAINYSH